MVCNKIVRLNVVFFVVMEIFLWVLYKKKKFVSTSHYSGGIFFGGLWIVLHSVGEIILYILSLVLNSQIFLDLNRKNFKFSSFDILELFDFKFRAFG